MAGRAATDAIIKGKCAISVNDPGHPLPKGWSRAALTDVADLGTGHTPSRNEPDYWDGDIPWIGIRDAGANHGKVITDTAQHVTELGLDNSAAVLLPKDTVCLSRTASVGYVVKMGRDMATSQDFVNWTCSEAIDPDYLLNALLAEGEDIRRFGEGSTHTTIYFPEVKAFHIDLPPAAEQRRIVAKLDALTARIARARAGLDRVAVLAKSLRQSALSDAASQGSSDLSLLEVLAKPIRNGLSVKGSDLPPGVTALRLSALRGQVVDLLDVRYLPISDERALAYRLEDGDLLISRGNGTLSLVGKAALVSGEGIDAFPIFPDTAFRIRVDRTCMSPEWLSFIWNSHDVRIQIEGMARTTAGIWKISQRDLAAIKLPRLSLARQQQSLKRLQAAFARADRMEAEAARARKLLDRLESAILARAFRGELVPQDPNDEPASVLLERIRAERAKAPMPERGRRKADP